MNPENIPYDLIDKYLNGELAPDHAFVQQLAQDSELREEVELQKIVTSAVIDNCLLEVKKVLNKYKEQDKQVPKKSSKWFFWSVPTIVIGIAGFVYWQKTNIPIIAQKEIVPIVIAPLREAASDTITETKLAETKPTTVKQSAIKVPISESGTIENEEKSIEIIPVQVQTIVPKTDNLILNNNSYVNSAKTVQNPCVDVHIKAIVSPEKPCKGASTGSIKLENTRGGNEPHSYSIDNGANWQNEATFSDLKSGIFQIAVKDANNCISTLYKEFHLADKSCVNIEQHYFNPQHETWEVPTKQDKNGKLTILDKSGQVVYTHPFDTAEQLIWNGSSQNNQTLLPGTYVYMIDYQDGLFEKGNVTLSY